MYNINNFENIIELILYLFLYTSNLLIFFALFSNLTFVKFEKYLYLF